MDPHEVINGPMERLPRTMSRPWFAFRIVPFVSPVGFSDRHAELLRRISAIQSEFKNSFVKGVIFVPKTEIEKLKSAEYDKLNGAYRSLPDYYFQDISLQYIYDLANFWSPGEVEPSWAASDVVDERFKAECIKTFQIVTSPLTKYDYSLREE